MNWGLVSSGNPYRAPLAAKLSRSPDVSSAWSGSTGHGSSSSSKGSGYASNAAVSALALLSFLFFLNMLQQQLSAGQQQTLLFMVNNTGNATRNRRRRPLIAVASVQAKQMPNGRTKLTVKAMRNGKVKKMKKKRRPRDVEDVENKEAHLQHLDPGAVHEEQNDHSGGVTDEMESESSELEEVEEEEEVEEAEEALPIMMPGLAGASSMQLSAWLHGKLSVDQLRNDLVDTLTNCRAVVACTMHRTAKGTDLSNALPDSVIRKLLGEAGEYAEPGHMDEACEDLLQAAGDDCNTLAQSFSSLLPPLDKTHNPAISHSNEPLQHSTQNVKGDL